jgi:hypothetical protein
MIALAVAPKYGDDGGESESPPARLASPETGLADNKETATLIVAKSMPLTYQDLYTPPRTIVS